MRVCTVCRDVFPESLAQAHLATCLESSLQHIKEAASVRPDKWIELRSDKGNNMIEVVIDVSIVAGTTATNINAQASILDGLRDRERRKHALYGEAAKARGEKLMVVAVTPNGTLSEDTKEFARMIAKTSDSRGAYTARHAERDIKRAVLIGSSVSLINAEKAAKIYYSPQAVRDVEQIMKPHDAPSDENEPEWYELPEDAPPPSLVLGKNRNSIKKSLRNSVLPSPVDPSLLPTPSPLEDIPPQPVLLSDCFHQHQTPNKNINPPLAVPSELLRPSSFPTLMSAPPSPLDAPVSGDPRLSTATQQRPSSLPTHLSAPPSPSDVSFSAEPGCSLSAKDSQKTHVWSSPSDIPCLGVAEQPPKKR